jgi:GTP cyclohydrolase I
MLDKVNFNGENMLEQSFKENTTTKSTVINDVISCDTKDESGLNDFQKLPTAELIAIPKVGITNFRLPIQMKNKFGEIRSHDCIANMYVDLNERKNGVSMSRLCNILQQTAGDYTMNADFFKKLLGRYRDELRDETDDDLVNKAFIRIKFNFPVKQKSLRSENWGWQYYPVEIEAVETKDEGFRYYVSMTYEYSSTCPCSLSMAKQYELDYQAGKITEGSGIGVPHSQRSTLKAKFELDPSQPVDLEDLVILLRAAIPTETQSLVKRLDEQAFAILNGSHPMFVEHASKRLYKTLNEAPFVLDWLCQLEHLESLHSHNAAAVIYKGVKNGLRSDNIF